MWMCAGVYAQTHVFPEATSMIPNHTNEPAHTHSGAQHFQAFVSNRVASCMYACVTHATHIHMKQLQTRTHTHIRNTSAHKLVT